MIIPTVDAEMRPFMIWKSSNPSFLYYLGLDEPGKPCAIGGAAARLFEESAQMGADGGVQECMLRLAPAPGSRERTAGCAGDSL